MKNGSEKVQRGLLFNKLIVKKIFVRAPKRSRLSPQQQQIKPTQGNDSFRREPYLNILDNLRVEFAVFLVVG